MSDTFTPNKNGNGVESHFSDSGKRVVLSLYNNHTLLIQGSGCWSWKATVFKSICEALKNTNMKMGDSSNHCDSDSDSDVTFDTPSSASKSKSPVFSLSKMVNNIRSARSRSSLGQINRYRSMASQQLEIPSTTPKGRKTNGIDTDDDVTLVKQLFSSKPSKVVDGKSTMTDQISAKIPALSDNQTQSSVGNGVPDTLNSEETSAKQKIDNESQLCKQELEKSLKLLREKYNKQSSKTGKLEQEVARLKITLKTETDKNGNLKCELSSTTRKQMVVEEDNTKLRNTIGQITREKSELVT